MARHRRTGSRNWTRGLFATFWILLGGLSGAYLFTAFTNPTALGGQLVASDTAGGETPASDKTTSAIGTEPEEATEKEIAEINERLRQLTEQVASLNTRFKPIEKVVGPVAALPPATSVTTSMPGAPPATPAPETKPSEAEATPPPPAAEPQAEDVKPEPAEEPKPAEAPKDEAKPVEQAAIEPAEEVKPEPPSAPSGPPPVAVSPLEEDAPEEAAAPETNAPESSSAATEEPPAPAAAEASPTPTQPAETESAALDPIALPPAANDGSTRYGIEIGSVAKQDALRPLWREFLTNHAALVAGLQPRRVLAPDKKWRLIAGPFGSADEASQACALFKKASRPCEATVYAGDAL